MENRRSTRVRQPPGGRCSDIFGDSPSEPRRTRNTNHLKLTVFGDVMEIVATSKTNEASHDHPLKSESAEENKVVETVEKAFKSVEKEVDSEKKPVETVEKSKVVEAVEENKVVETVEKAFKSVEKEVDSEKKPVETVEKAKVVEAVEENKVVETVEKAFKSVEKEVASEKKPVETVEKAKVAEAVEENKVVETVEKSKVVKSLENAFMTVEKVVKTVEEGKPVETASIDDLAVIADSVRVGATSYLNQAGNPLTGEGYAIANGVKMAASPTASVPSPVKMNGDVESKTNETDAAPPLPQPAVPRRVRQPPGGFCSGHW